MPLILDLANKFSQVDSFQHFATIDSTNAEALRFAEKHPGLNGLFIADEQTAGRGRLRRPWLSPAGQGLWVSFLLGRSEWQPTNSQFLSFYAGVIIVRLLSHWVTKPAGLKWPNDIYLNNCKVGGVLIEAKWQGDQPQCFVVGIGLNLRQTPADFPPEVRASATSLIQHSLKHEIHRPDMLYDLTQLFFENWDLLESPTKLIQSWHQAAIWLNQDVALVGGENMVEGIYRGINQAGELILETTTGEKTFPAGEISLRSRI